MTTPRTPRGRSSRTFVVLVLALAAMAAGGRPARAQAPPSTASLDETLKALSRYQGGIDSAPMWRLRDHIAACRDEPSARAECERKLLAFLKTSPPQLARMAVCRQLRVIGSDAAVPVLQAMLKDDRSADMAIYALQQIPGAAAESSLVQALQTAKGDTKIALIAALGQRKSQAAVPALAPLLQQPAFSRPTAVALGRIGGDSAASRLTAAYAGAPPDLKPVVAASLMTCAEAQLAAGDATAALRLYEALLPDTSLPAPLHRAAAMGKIIAAGKSAPNVVLEMLGGSDPILHEAAVARIKTAFGPDAIDPVSTLLPRLPEATQAQVLGVLSGYPAERVRQAVLRSVEHPAVQVRVAALQALGLVGDPAAVPLLAGRAAGVRGPEQVAARAALGALKGRAVDEAIVTLLGQKPSDAVAGELLLAVADRRIFTAKTAVAATLASASGRLRVQALKTLRVVGTPSDLPAVLDLLLASTDDVEQAEAENAAAALSHMIADPIGRARTVRMRLATATGAEARVRLIHLLPLIGDASTLPVLRSLLARGTPEICEAAVRALADWPTSAARDDLLRLSRDSRDETQRLLAIHGLVRSVGLDPYRDPAAAVADLQSAAEYSWRPEEQMLVLGALTQFPCREALDLAAGFLRAPPVEAEAQATIDTLNTLLAKEAIRK